MSRLKKIAESDDMSFEEIKEETLQAIKNMQNNVNEWSIRDVLTIFTQFNFYKGEPLTSIDESTAANVCKQLLNYVENIANENQIMEVYYKVYHYAAY